jgi:hypothetical protein
LSEVGWFGVGVSLSHERSFFCVIAALGIFLSFPSILCAQLPLNQRVLVVYNSGNAASTAVEKY